MAASGGTTPTVPGTSSTDRAGTKDMKDTTTTTAPAATSTGNTGNVASMGITAIMRGVDHADLAAAEGSRVAADAASRPAGAVSTGTGAGDGLSAATCGRRP
jgi:hypothetical protein